MYALVDCNNFFVSCERVFNPKLQRKPVVVLSGNDGCVVARSKEAKDLGIPMGAPAFEYAALFKKYGVHLFTGNFSLYLSLSERVMQTLKMFCPEMEVYSIDEAFFSLDGIPEEKLLTFCKEVQYTILQWTGIPVSIGIAPTKTLTKVAISYAKEKLSNGLFLLRESNLDASLEKLPIEEIWGIGRRLAERLKAHQIYTAKQLRDADDAWIKKELTVVGLRLAWELRGIQCLTLDEIAEPKKSISTAKSFAYPIVSFNELESIIASYTASVAEKLRSQDSVASYLVVSLETNRFAPESYYSRQASYVLPEPTSYTPTLIRFAKMGLSALFKEGLSYKRAAVLLGNFSSKDIVQQDLLHRRSQKVLDKEQKVMELMDGINAIYGKKTVRLAIEKDRPVKNSSLSQSFMTCWNSLPVAFV